MKPDFYKNRKSHIYNCKICGKQMESINRILYCNECRVISRHWREKECRERKKPKNTTNKTNLTSCIVSAEKNKMSYGQYMAARRAGKIIE